MPIKGNLKVALFGGNTNFTGLNNTTGMRMWRKQVLSYGQWIHPSNKDITFEVTPVVVDQIIENFNRGIPVELPVVMTHTDDPRFKAGVIRAYIKTDKGLDVVMSVSDEEMNKKIDDPNQAPGVSCWLDLEYRDKQTGDSVGAVVKHVALVNHPYIEGMGSFSAVLSEGGGNQDEYVTLVLSEVSSVDSKEPKVSENATVDVSKGEENTPVGDIDMPEINKETAVKYLKETEQIDVDQLLSDAVEYKKLHDRVDSGELVAKEDAVVSLSDELVAQITPHLALSEEDKKNPGGVIAKLLAKIVELAGTKTTVADLQSQLSELKADQEVGIMLSEKRILPIEKDVFKKMWLENKSLYDDMAKLRTKPVVVLGEMGAATNEVVDEKAVKAKKTEDEVERHLSAAKKEKLVR